MDRIKILSSQTISAGGYVESVPIDTSALAGFFTLELQVSGSGVVRADHLITVSEAAGTYKIPDGAAPIITGVTSTTNTNGVVVKQFNAQMGRKIVIRVSETGASAAATVTAYLLVH